MLITYGYRQMVAEAEARIETITVAQALAAFDAGDTVFIDLRDIRELRHEGKIPGAQHVPRGLLEFWIDPESPYHKPLFAAPHRFIFYCNLGWRSALAADVAQRMGLARGCHLAGGFAAWVKAGGAVEALAK